MQVPAAPSVAEPTIALQGPGVAPGAATAFGGGVGNALQDVGNNLGGLGVQLKEMQLKTQRFAAMKAFSDFQTQTAAALTDMQQNAPVGQNNFTDQAVATYKNMAGDFLNKLGTYAPDLQEEYSAQTAQLGHTVADQAANFQLKSTKTYYSNAIDDEAQKSLQNIGVNPSVETLTAEQDRLNQFIAATGLSPEEKVAMTRKYYSDLEKIAYKGAYKATLTDPEHSVAGQAATLINAVGGDAAHSPNLNYEENQQALQDRIVHYAQEGAKAVGSLDLWSKIPDHVQAAIISNMDANGGVLTPELKEAIQSGSLDNIAKAMQAQNNPRANIEASIANGSMSTGAAALDNNPAFANLAYEDRLAVRADADREVTAETTAATKAKDAELASVMNAAKIAADKGEFGQADLDHLQQLYPQMKASDYSELQHALSDKTNTVIMAKRASDMIQQGRTFDPSNPDDKAGLNALVGEDGLNHLAKLDGDYLAQGVIPMVKATGDIPTNVAGTLTAMIRSPDQQKQLWALDALSQLQKANPQAFAQRVDAKTASSVNMFDVARNYYPADQVSALVSGPRDPAQAQALDADRAEADKILKSTAVKGYHPVADFVQQMGKAGGWLGMGKTDVAFPVNPATSESLMNDFRSIFVDEYPKYKDPKLATDAAIKILGREWGVTDVGGSPTIMRNPPEKVGYPPISGNYNWIADQVRSDLKLPKGTSFQLIGDDQTKHEAATWQANGGQNAATAGPDDRQIPPSYAVVTKDANGVTHLAVDAKGRPARLFFNVTPELRTQNDAHLVHEQQQVMNQAFLDMYSKAQQHSLETGVPIPAELVQEYHEKFGATDPATEGITTSNAPVNTQLPLGTMETH